jgi:hypothetical protein
MMGRIGCGGVALIVCMGIFYGFTLKKKIKLLDYIIITKKR